MKGEALSPPKKKVGGDAFRSMDMFKLALSASNLDRFGKKTEGGDHHHHHDEDGRSRVEGSQGRDLCRGQGLYRGPDLYRNLLHGHRSREEIDLRHRDEDCPLRAK